MKSVLITGATGFVGSHLIRQLPLHDPNFEFVALGRHITGVPTGIRYFEGDIVRSSILDRIDSPIHVIIHLAANAHHCDGADCILDNTYSVFALLQKVATWNTERFIFLSSSAIYEIPSESNIADENSSIRPRDLYGLTKFLAETILEHSQIPTFILRSTYLYGEDNYGSGLFNLLQNIKRGGFAEVRDESRDYLHVHDAVKAIMTVLQYQGDEHVFNIGSGRVISMAEIAKRAIAILRIDSMLSISGVRSNICLDCRRAHKELEWTPSRYLINDLDHILSIF